jgi:hypothetical protein
MSFEIRVRGDWTPAVAEQFADAATRIDPDCVVLTAELDQAGLHGLLERVRVLGLELVDVRRSRPARRGASG